MKKAFIITSLVFLAGFLYAQHEPEAKEILDKLSAKTKTYNTISADFTVFYESVQENIQNTSQGSIIIKGDKYKLDFMGSKIFFNGETIWSYMKEINEVNITVPEEGQDDMLSNPQKIFTIYEDGFKARVKDELVQNGKNIAVIDLVPENTNDQLARILLTINKDKMEILSAKSIGNDGTSFKITIKNLLANKQIADNAFNFEEKDYPGVEVIDLR